MPDERHEELAAYLLGRLDEGEAARFRDHLAGCERCRAEEVELREVAGLLQRTIPSQLPADLEARTLAAVAAAPTHREPTNAAVPAGAGPGGAEPGGAAPAGAAEPGGATTPPPTSDELAARRERRRGSRVVALAAAAAAGLVIAFVLGTGTAEDTTTTVAKVTTVTVPKTVTVPDTALPGAEEKTATLDGDGFQAAARVNVIGPGRLVAVKSRTIPKIPKGTYYELWFVGPGDAPQTPNRISAGTWHPDKLGVTDVRFLIAADPKKFPDIEVTREPPDGDPRPSGRVVLEST